MKTRILLLFLLSSWHFFAQSTISGYINNEDSFRKNKKVVLAQLINENINTGKISKIIAVAKVDKQGYFIINKILPERQQLYYVYLESSQHTTIYSKKFLLTNNDSIHFSVSDIPFKKYITTNLADKEWQKLILLKETLDVKKSKEKKYLDEIRTYSKDSLQILAVKLLSIKELNTKNLLTKDIQLNKTYYTALLAELKNSDIEL